MLVQAKIDEGQIALDDELGQVYFNWDMRDLSVPSIDAYLSKESTRKLYELLDSFKSSFL